MNGTEKGWSTIDQEQQPDTRHEGLHLEDLEETYQVEFRALVQKPFEPIGAVYIKNGCCKNRPVLITANRTTSGRLNFSCQCACGLWCTSGARSASGALQQWERMSAGEDLYGEYGKFKY